MTAFVGLLPALLLFGGALLIVAPLPFPPIVRSWIPLAACALAFASVVFFARAPEPLTLFPPNDALPALTLTVQWGGATPAFALMMLMVLGGRFLFGMNSDAPDFLFGSLTAAAGALVFLAADNFTTVAVAWVFVELGLLAVPAEQGDARAAASRAFGWNLAAIVAWLTAAMVVANFGISLRLSEVALDGPAAFLVLIAVWIRSGLYPFQIAAPTTINTLGVRMGLPLLLGGYLMTRLLMQTRGAMAFDSEMAILATLSVGLSALIVIGQVHGSEALMWMLRAFGAPMLLLPFFVNARSAPALSVWFAVGAFVVCHFIEIAMQWRAELPRVRLTLMVWLAALVMIASLPLAPTFWSRVGLLAAAYAETGIVLWLLLVATMSLVLVPLWREIFASNQVAPKAPSLAEYGALALMALPALSLSVLPFVFVAPMGAPVQAGGARVYDALFQPPNFVALIFLLAGLMVPLLASLELARRWTPRANLLPTRVTNFLELNSIASMLDRAYRFLRALVQHSLALLEQPPMAWLLFLLIWVAIWIISLNG